MMVSEFDRCDCVEYAYMDSDFKRKIQRSCCYCVPTCIDNVLQLLWVFDCSLCIVKRAWFREIAIICAAVARNEVIKFEKHYFYVHLVVI